MPSNRRESSWVRTGESRWVRSDSDEMHSNETMADDILLTHENEQVDESLQPHPSTSPRVQPSYARIRKWLEDVLVGSTDPECKQHQCRRRRKLVAVSLAVVLAAYWRFSKRHNRRTSATTSSSQSKAVAFTSTCTQLWPIGLLLGWWKGPEYRQSLQESTMSLLWNAAKDGIVQRAMIGSSAVFFQTKRQFGDKQQLQWNRAVFPPNNDSIKAGLLEALASGGCRDVQAIPESIWSKLAPALLAALPFVYLIFLYRLMKNQFGGDDISSKLFSNGTRKGASGKQGDDDRTTFADVAGLPTVVEDLKEVANYLANPELYSSMGARPPQGVLLHGPPGNGSEYNFGVCV
jgi:hypothetical protein